MINITVVEVTRKTQWLTEARLASQIETRVHVTRSLDELHKRSGSEFVRLLAIFSSKAVRGRNVRQDKACPGHSKEKAKAMPGKKPKAAKATNGEAKSEFNVLVSGFDRWTAHPEPNPSYLITSSLPKKVTLHRQAAQDAVINIAIHEAPVPVYFAEIDALIPKLYDGKHCDFVLHTGIAPGITWYEVETHAQRSGYKTKDESGFRPDEHPGYGGRQASVRFETCVLDLGTERVVKRWKDECKDKSVDLKISRDAGLFVCEYITYASLAYLQYHKNHLLPPDQRTGVAFLHAPALRDDAAIERGKEVYIGLLKALVALRLEDG